MDKIINGDKQLNFIKQLRFEKRKFKVSHHMFFTYSKGQGKKSVIKNILSTMFGTNHVFAGNKKKVTNW